MPRSSLRKEPLTYFFQFLLAVVEAEKPERVALRTSSHPVHPWITHLLSLAQALLTHRNSSGTKMGMESAHIEIPM
jgi:hypothetical protein